MNRHFPALRGLAILLVVINHSVTLGLGAAREAGLVTAQIEKVILIAFKELGIVAVPIFLFLAACFFVYGAQEKTIRQGYGLVFQGLPHILVPYLVWSLVYCAVALWLFGDPISPAIALKNLIVGYPYNFVPLLVLFDLLAPLLVWAVRRSPGLVLAAFFAFQLILINLLQPGWLGFRFPNWMGVLAVPVFKLPLAVWGVFYPLGLAYSLHTTNWTPVLKKWRNILAFLSLGLFLLAWLTQVSVIQVPLAEILAPIPAMLILASLNRKEIPFPRQLESLGKRSYGLYLTNLLVISILVALVKTSVPWLLHIQSALVLGLITITLVLPILIMQWVERVPGRATYRLVFG